MGGAGGGGAPILYADPSLLIAFSSGDSEYAAYAARISAVTTYYKFLDPSTQTYDGFVTAFAALSATDKRRILLNMEYPWLEVLMQLDSEGVDATWRTDAAVIAEGSRQGYTIGVGTTLAQYRAIAAKLWRDCCDYALANGCESVTCYGSAGLSFSEPTGAPWAGWFPSLPASGTTYWLSDPTFHPTIGQQSATITTGQGAAHLIAAQRNATHHGLGMYSWVPVGSQADNEIASWSASGIVRKNASGTVTPDFVRSDLDTWTKATTQWLPQAYADLADSALAASQITSDQFPKSLCTIVFPPCVPPYVGGYVENQRWTGLGMKTTAGWLANEVMPFLQPANSDTRKGRRPDAVMLWCDVRSYFSTYPSNARAGGNAERLTNMARNAHEVEFLKRTASPAGDPFPYGSTTQATLDTWYTNNSLADGWWNTDANGPWWKRVGGNQLGSACTLDNTSPLAPYLNFSANITRTHVLTAIRHYASEKMASAVESCASAASWRRSAV